MNRLDLTFKARGVFVRAIVIVISSKRCLLCLYAATWFTGSLSFRYSEENNHHQKIIRNVPIRLFRTRELPRKSWGKAHSTQKATNGLSYYSFANNRAQSLITYQS